MNIADKNLNNSKKDPLPTDPSNTGSIGQKVEQGVVNLQEGISEQSSKWEDTEERSIPTGMDHNDTSENYLKNPSPEDNSTEGIP